MIIAIVGIEAQERLGQMEQGDQGTDPWEQNLLNRLPLNTVMCRDVERHHEGQSCDTQGA